MISFMMVERALESPCVGISIAHSTGVTSTFPKKLWVILSSLYLSQKLASTSKYGKVSFETEKSNPFSVDQISATMISFIMVECAMKNLMYELSIAHLTIIKDIMVAEIWSTENGLDFSVSKLILPYLLVEPNF